MSGTKHNRDTSLLPLFRKINLHRFWDFLVKGENRDHFIPMGKQSFLLLQDTNFPLVQEVGQPLGPLVWIYEQVFLKFDCCVLLESSGKNVQDHDLVRLATYYFGRNQTQSITLETLNERVSKWKVKASNGWSIVAVIWTSWIYYLYLWFFFNNSIKGFRLLPLFIGLLGCCIRSMVFLIIQ